jgi:hypothetical protein
VLNKLEDLKIYTLLDSIIATNYPTTFSRHITLPPSSSYSKFYDGEYYKLTLDQSYAAPTFFILVQVIYAKSA